MSKEIKRSPKEIEAINKEVDKKRATGNKVVEVIKDERKEVVAPNMSKKEYEALIKAYKKQSPVKYEMKKEVFKAKLKMLK